MDHVLEVHGACKTFPGFFLRDVSFSLPRGFIMGLIGPNGAGKTTMMGLILNLVRLDAGEIRLFGQAHDENEGEVRARVGFVHENPTYHMHLSVAAAAAAVAPFYPGWKQDTFRSLLREFGLSPEKKLRVLSRGMRTRFALAVALSHGAELLLLDEPSSGLDPAFRRELLDRLSGIIEGGQTSVLFSTHITSDLDRIADFITFLRDGQVVFSEEKDLVLERWALVKGPLELLTEDAPGLFDGVVKGEFGFVGLTRDPAMALARFGEGKILVERATLEDIVYYTGRAGPLGLRLHAEHR